ncbi:hypothetical protein Hamer_G000814 [Homarus americanus]|uniref:DUF4817 domain-containing protein n=1 Tax=Homarus americanus TaxID=6706 RepID=A0A8J5T1Z5_HOMAM|nr:hypothetical protein Hamer_G000814 [Homarus americanus]
MFRTKYGKKPPDVKFIKSWMKILETVNVEKGKSSGRLSVSDGTVENIPTAFTRSPRKSVKQASRRLQMPKSTVHKVLQNCMKLHAYKVQIVHQLMPDDRPKREQFANDILNSIDEDNDFLLRVCFSDKATFHVSGTVNKHNVRIWGSENPHVVREHIGYSLKTNVWCTRD